MSKHTLRYIDLHPQSIKPRRDLVQLVNDICAALTFAALIGLPFALYFALYMKP